jgi:nicotinamidase/pyrazinamidase
MNLKTWIMIAGGIVVVVVLLIGGILLWGWPTSGDPIAQYENPQQAVLVIDIQEDFTGSTAQPPFPFENSEQLIETVNTVTESAAGQDIIVVYIQQEYHGLWGRMMSALFSRGTGIEGTPGIELDKRLSLVSDHMFSKPTGDAFSNPELEAFLIEHQVNELYLVGLAAEACVHHTAYGALNREYTVNIITDAVALQDEEKREDLLQQYQEEGIALLTSEQFLEQTP